MARIPLPDGPADDMMKAFGLVPEVAVGAAAFSTAVYEQSPLPIRLRELVRIRIAQLNECDI